MLHKTTLIKTSSFAANNEFTLQQLLRFVLKKPSFNCICFEQIN